MNNEFNLISVVKTLLKWKWHIFSITIFAGIAAIIMTLFVMKPYYQSFAIIYPISQNLGDRNTLFSQDGSSIHHFFGSDRETNRILSIANSSKLTSYIVKKYNLAEHYKLKGKRYEASKTMEEFEENYTAYKTDKDAIRINLLDTDPDLAAEIVNDIVSIINDKTTKPVDQNKAELADIFAKKEAIARKKIDSLQVDLLSTNSGTKLFELKEAKYKAALEDYNKLAAFAGEYALAAEKSNKGIEIIEDAFPAERKIKPIRSLICIATTIIAFFLACFGALLTEQIIYIKKEIEE